LSNTTSQISKAISMNSTSWRSQMTKKIHPRTATTNGGQPFWDTHPAKFICVAEIKSGVIDGLTPQQVRERNHAYKAFDLPHFREYLNMEKRNVREAVF
jgi:hypothetical protein